MDGRVTRSRRQLSEQQEQQSRARWTTSLTKTLADLIIEQVQKGNRKNNSFVKKVWRHMCSEFNKKTGLRWDKEQLKNRYAVLRRQYVTLKSIIDRDDFTWYESTGTILANDEVWAKYIKDHPDAETIKTGGCQIFNELCIIFSEPTTNGSLYQSEHAIGTQSSLPFSEPISTQEESSSESEEIDDITTDDQDPIQPSTPSSTINRKRGRKGIDDVIAGAILEMAAASKLRTAAAQQCNARYSIGDCIKELDEIQGLEEHLYFSAIDLFNKPYARETFLSLKADKQLIWLRRKCNPY